MGSQPSGWHEALEHNPCPSHCHGPDLRRVANFLRKRCRRSVVPLQTEVLVSSSSSSLQIVRD